MAEEIVLTQGQVAIIDDADFPFISRFKWCAHKRRKGYVAVRNIKIPGKGWRPINMSRFLLNPSDNSFVDHINGNGLDNRRANLRFATPAQNQYNRAKNKNSASRFKGVRRDGKGHWMAAITYKRKAIHLGTFSTEKTAAHAYDVGAKILFREYARFNMGNAIWLKTVP